MKRLKKYKLTYLVTRITGKGRGEKMGIPTINFALPHNLDLSFGVYAAWIIHEGKKYKSALHFGPRPTFNETDASLEAYILDGDIPINNDTFQIQFVARIRDASTFLFKNQKDMLERIYKDIYEVQTVLT